MIQLVTPSWIPLNSIAEAILAVLTTLCEKLPEYWDFIKLHPTESRINPSVAVIFKPLENDESCSMAFVSHLDDIKVHAPVALISARTALQLDVFKQLESSQKQHYLPLH